MYCLEGCAQKARLLAQRQAGRRYQTSRRGRLNHAARSRRYRARKNNVTHQGSPPAPPDDLLLTGSAVAVTDQTMTGRGVRPRWHCHCCGRLCPEFVRRDFLRCRQGPRINRRGHLSDRSRMPPASSPWSTGSCTMPKSSPSTANPIASKRPWSAPNSGKNNAAEENNGQRQKKKAPSA